jgi:hypothetical protein
MDTKVLKTGFGLAVAIAALALPPTALAQRVVPPGNSAVTQYTETIPSAGGSVARKHGRQPSPAKVLGNRNARRLQARGPEGREAAAVAAATAPVPAASTSLPETSPGQPQTGPGTSPSPHSDPLPDGSSGLSRVIGEATGSSDSGDLGILLPLLILAAVLGSAAYFWRHRHRVA